ncbi:hypothetical protein [Kingella kingae]|uniref:hypothetical protein n=1 Tax=Kingella kingae TaxID=504 RepID=UPI000423D1A7|nr:hypothetical protein [Kingella kingae]
MFFVDRMAAVLKPTEAFWAWLKQHNLDFPDLTVEQLCANCSVFLLPVFDEPEEAVAYVGERYQSLFAAELASWSIDEKDFPQPFDLAQFWAFFELDVHDMVLDLEEAQWQGGEVWKKRNGRAAKCWNNHRHQAFQAL